MHFLSVLNEDRIRAAEQSLRSRLGLDSLVGKSFLDIGSGSGLFSLAARRLGATVRSFDYDPESVACTEELKRRYFRGDPDWEVERGSVLDRDYLDRLGTFDIVYSWGVLHHTGRMWQAIENAAITVKPNGILFIAIYNDQGWASRGWRAVKYAYNRSPRAIRGIIIGIAWVRLRLPSLARKLAQAGESANRARGMSSWYDLVDWVGGYPFEVATPDMVVDFLKDRRFATRQIVTVGRGLACNEFVFEKH